MICSENKAFPAVAALYFTSYVTITAFCVIPFFISAVFISMSDYVEAMREIDKNLHRKQCIQSLSKLMNSYNSNFWMDTHSKISLKYLNIAFKGHDILQHVSLEDSVCKPGIFNCFCHYYQMLAMKCYILQENSLYRKLIVCVITCGG